MAEWVTPWAARTVREGLSARSGLRAFRQAGGRVSDATWFRAVTEARNTIGRRGDITGTALNRRPTSDQYTDWTTRNARGVIQQIEVMVRDRDTGDVFSIPFSHRSRNGVTWQTAINDALNTITPEGTDGERQQILGAIPVAAIRMTPGG